MNEILDNDLFQAFSTASDYVYIYVCDVATNLSRWSPNAVAYFDLPGQYIYDAGSIWVQYIHPNDVAKYKADIERVFSGQSTEHRCEYRAMNRFGDYVWLECRGTMMLDDNGKPRLFAGMLTRLDAQNKYDPHTSLENLQSFNLLNNLSGTGSVLLISIDGFRDILKHFDREICNRMLHSFCARMQSYCEEAHVIYHLEGDRFLIVSPGANHDDTQRLFDHIQEIAQQTTLDGQPGWLTLLGGAMLYPADVIDPKDLLSNLEHSLQHAANSKISRLVFFSERFALSHQHTLQLKHALTMSIQNNYNGFSLCFQPMVSALDHRIICCEALLRWQQDGFKPTPISDVIKLLEASGEICSVGRWVIQQVFAQAVVWQKEYPDLMVGINVSYQQFKDDAFVDELIKTAQSSGIDPCWICLELTESSMVEDLTRLARDFKKLRDFGFRISLDDFGIAYSTLLLIRTLPVDSVKIDHSFILNLTEENHVDIAIIESVVSLCARLGIRVVAEGVETEKTLAIMNGFVIDMFQGYYFSRPVNVQDFEKLLGESREAQSKQTNREMHHIKLHRLTSPNSTLYDDAMSLYCTSFPLHEQRLDTHQHHVLSHEPAYHFDLIMTENAFGGILLYWETDEFLYVEHFAIVPHQRGNGLGTEALRLLCAAGKTIILEIDPPADELSISRKHFYERFGFVVNPFAHVHPPYRHNTQGHALVVMSYPKELSLEQYQAFYTYLATTVMTYAEREDYNERAEFTNMCMLEDADGRVLVQKRLNPRWPGISFPGGHVDRGESFVQSVIREMREETGLCISNPRLCGVKQFQTVDGRYCVLLFKANTYCGELRGSEEGDVFWVKRDKLPSLPLAPDFDKMIRLFDDDTLSECCYSQTNGEWQCEFF